MPKTYSDKEIENLFLEIWWKISEETYNTLWQEDIKGADMIADLVDVNPRLYKRIMRILVDKLEE